MPAWVLLVPAIALPTWILGLIVAAAAAAALAVLLPHRVVPAQQVFPSPRRQ